MRPKRANATNALPSRRDVIAVLAALGGAAVFSNEANGEPEAAASATPTTHTVVLAPNMGRVRLVFAKPPFGRITVTVGGAVLPDDAVVLEGDAPTPAASASSSPAAAPAAPHATAPSATPSASAPPPGPVRYGLFAPEGRQTIRVTTENGYEAYAEANVIPAGSVDVAVDPQPPPPPPGGMPASTYMGSGCCGGDHGASEARARSATPSIAAAAIAGAALLLRRGSDRGR